MEIKRRTGQSKPTVWRWQNRFMEEGVAGLLHDKTRPPGTQPLNAAVINQVLAKTATETPAEATQWSGRAMAKAVGISLRSVQRIWAKHDLKPHLAKTFKLSNDPNFAEKRVDIVALHLDPPDKALVLAVDEKSQIQALDRTQPGLPLKKRRAGTMTHDYKRNGTTTLFAALNTLDGTVIGQCMDRHRHQEFIKFLRKIDRNTPADLDLHLIADTYATHKHPDVVKWLERHPRFHLHFTPTSSSWLNLVERFFAEITRKRIRRGVFKSVLDLEAAIYRYLGEHNDHPKRFVWTKTADQILEKVERARPSLKKVVDTKHQSRNTISILLRRHKALSPIACQWLS
jgi:transposase